MARRKTTLYIDDELLAAAKALAISTARRESDVVEEALRAYVQEAPAAAWNRLFDLIERVRARSQISDQEAMDLAYDQLHIQRRQRTGGARRP